MPDAKISELPAATAPTGVELIEIVQGGVNKQTTTQDIADLASGGVSSVFTRSGAVVATNGDYTATQVTNTPAGGIAATTVQAAIDELDTEKQSAAQVTTAIAPYVITEVSASTAGATITLNFQVSSIDRQNVIFIGSASFTGSKTFALSNTTVAKNFFFVFEVTSFAGVAVTVPADWSLSTPDFTTGTTWTPTANGRYRMSGVFVNSLWEVFVDGPASV